MKCPFPQARVLFTGIPPRKAHSELFLAAMLVSATYEWRRTSDLFLCSPTGRKLAKHYVRSTATKMAYAFKWACCRKHTDEHQDSHTVTSYKGGGFPSEGQGSSLHHRPSQSQKRQSDVKDLMVICSERRGRKLEIRSCVTMEVGLGSHSLSHSFPNSKHWFTTCFNHCRIWLRHRSQKTVG